MHVTPSSRRLAVVLVLTLAVTSFAIGRHPAVAAIPEPAQDAFYTPPAGFETTAPGTILRTRPVTVTGLGIPWPVTSTQMLVRSTDAKGQPVAIVSTLMVPLVPYLFGPRPLLSYQPATDSLGDQCNPSYTLQTGAMYEIALLTLGLLQGWAVVVTDYQGPRNAYGAGRMEGHAVLDGIRAAEQLPNSRLAGTTTKVGLWGYSGGGLATSWAAELQPTYAPELNLVGVASGGTPADLAAAARVIDGSIFSGLGLAAIVGISREYPEILPLLNDNGRALVAAIGDMCAAQEASSYPFRRISEFTDSPDPLAEPTAIAVLNDNALGYGAPTAPVFLFHSVLDELIPFNSVEALRSSWCSQGTPVQFYADYASEHTTLAITGAPVAVAYLGTRFLGIPAPSNC